MTHLLLSLADAFPVILIFCAVCAWIGYEVGKARKE
jgi:hypothetical protein